MTNECPKCQTNNPDTLKFCGECGTPLEAEVIHTKTLETQTEELTTGSTFAERYQIIEELGKGGMGRVYKVLDKETKEKVALKLINPEIASDKKTIERFKNELTTARKIRHKNVCGMHYLGEYKGRPYITMEHISGEDLKSSIRRFGNLPIGKSISIAKQICEGLEEAHNLGIVHRDLKPNNIMIDDNGNARIMDFGIARSIKGKGITGLGVMIGTPEYMSPEQVEAKDVDQSSDIYSLGIIMYEMLTGRLPFEADTPFAVGIKHKSETPKNPKEINPQIPDDLSGVILKCLEKEKENRYQSAFELRSELEMLEQGLPTTDRIIPQKKPLSSREITVQFNLKKIFIPAFGVIAIAVIGLILWSPWARKDVEKITSIAVLPFADVSPQKDQEYLCDGMTDEIISKLSRIKGWKVMNRTSIMLYKNSEKDPKTIGQELGVTTILEGSVRMEKDNIRILVQLINAEDGFQIWSDSYDRKLESVFIIQNDIAENIAYALEAELSPEERTQLQKRHTDNLNAYKLYCQGQFFIEKRTEKDLKRAIELFDQAIVEDPTYALVYAGLATAYTLLPDYSSYPPQEAFPKAIIAVIKALEIDETLGEPHAVLGTILGDFYFDWEGAEKEYQRALELNPNNAVAHHWYAIFLFKRSRHEEAIEEIKQALELDPLSLVINRNTGWVYYVARKYDEAIELYLKTIEMDQDFIGTHFNLGKIYLLKSKYEDALKAFLIERKITQGSNTYAEVLIGVAYVKMGEKEKAEQILNNMIDLSKHKFITSYGLAWLYFALERIDEGFASLEKAYERREKGLTQIGAEPLFDSVRSDARFKNLLKKMNLE